jgi:hypothetical protein
MNMKLVKQKQISPRKMWPNEQFGFTPWLVEHIEELSETIGLDLEVIGREVSVGPYSADILAKDNDSNNYVVIENQLEKTNHDHLGKSITYASALNAKTIVWIATDFTEEHKKAFDWLNDNTNEDLAFWAIQLELWQVGEDTASMRFNIVCRPNSDIKTIKNKSNAESETTKTQLAYWTKFRDKLLATKKFSSARTPRPQYWFDVTLGRSGVVLSNTCNAQKSIVGVRLYIRNSVAEIIVPALEARKEEINKALGCEPEWFPNTNAMDKTISLQYQTNLSDPEKVEEALDWQVKYTIIFHDVFSKEIKAIK